MTNEEIIEITDTLNANNKTMKDHGISDNLWGKAVECIEFLQAENAELRTHLKRVAEFADYCSAEDCAGDDSVGFPACPLWDFWDIDENGNETETGCVLKKWATELKGEKE